jgi:AhpD family alkylhydroperoxidase
VSAREKELITLAVFATNGCDYCIDAHAAILKRMGISDRASAEVMAVVGHYNGINAFLEGLQIESDIKP